MPALTHTFLPNLTIAIQPPPGDCCIDALSLADHLRATVPSVRIQMEPTEATNGLIYLPKMTDQGASRRLEGILGKYPNIRWVQLPMSGVDEYRALMRKPIDGPMQSKRIWCSGKGTAAGLVAEHALALTLSLCRSIPRRCAASSWGDKLGSTLFGKHVLIVGYGGVAQRLIDLLRPFNCRISVVRRRLSGTLTQPAHPSTAPEEQRITTFYTVDDIDASLGKADVVVLALALTPQSQGLFDGARFRAMKPGSIFVNVSRGPIVDTEALVDAIRERRLGGVGIDVVDPEPLPDDHALWSLMRRGQEGVTDSDTAWLANKRVTTIDDRQARTQVIVTPHSAVTPSLIEPFLRERIRRNVAAFAQGGEMEGTVDTATGY